MVVWEWHVHIKAIVLVSRTKDGEKSEEVAFVTRCPGVDPDHRICHDETKKLPRSHRIQCLLSKSEIGELAMGLRG